MDSIAGAGALASIVSLIVDFRNQRRDVEDDNYSAFLEWLMTTRHEELAAEIQTNQRFAIGIKAALHEKIDVLLERFDQLDSIVAQISSRIGLFADLAHAIYPNITISAQAMSILRQFAESGADRFAILRTLDGNGPQLNLLGSAKRTIDYTERRFLDDDLTTLVGLQLLRVESGSRGTEFYRITRAAVALVKAADEER